MMYIVLLIYMFVNVMYSTCTIITRFGSDFQSFSCLCCIFLVEDANRQAFLSFGS